MRAVFPVVPAVLLSLSVLVGCESDSSGPDRTMASLTATTSTNVTGTVGAAVTAIPTVKAVDASGQPVSGVAVTFTVSGGGTLGRTTTTTDASGTASVQSWTLGTTAGPQTVVATANGQTVTFTASASAAAAATMTVVGGATNSAPVGAAVANKPSVQLKDQYGNAVAGATVVFSVVSGGGTVTGATVTTDATGTATVGGWTLGTTAGAQTLRATSGTLTANFAATADANTCVVSPYTIGASTAGEWSANDCANTTPFGPAGAKYDQYELNLATQQNVRFELTGAAGRSLRIRRKDTTDYVGLPLGASFTTTNGNTLIQRHLLGAGNYIVEVQAPATTGAYTLNSAIDNSDIVCRPVVQGSLGVSFNGTLSPTTDCESPVAPGTYEDWVVLPLKTGDRIRITLTTTTMPPGLVLRDDRLGPASPTLVVRTATTPGTLTIDWTATFDTYHEIVIFKNGGATAPYGPYTLTIERLP
jgi:hypothetical protein